MALDHFVPQVHLKNFYSPALDGKRMYALRKNDGKKFECRAKDVCRIEDGSTNSYLLHDRAIEEFLRNIEPRYNKAVAELISGQPSRNAIFVIAGFVAYVTSCSPTATRLAAQPLGKMVEVVTKTLDTAGELPGNDFEVGGKTIREMTEGCLIKVNVDQKYPQAFGISSIMKSLSTWGNSNWELIQSTPGLGSFFTSDFPAAIEYSDLSPFRDRIVPLAPNFAVKIRADQTTLKYRHDLSFPGLRIRQVHADQALVRSINTAIARCAEELVFFRDLDKWVIPFLEKQVSFGIECETVSVPGSSGTLNVSRLQVDRRKF